MKPILFILGYQKDFRYWKRTSRGAKELFKEFRVVDIYPKSLNYLGHSDGYYLKLGEASFPEAVFAYFRDKNIRPFSEWKSGK